MLDPAGREGPVWPGSRGSCCHLHSTKRLQGRSCPSIFTEVFSWRARVMTEEPESSLTSCLGHVLQRRRSLLRCRLQSRNICWQ